MHKRGTPDGGGLQGNPARPLRKVYSLPRRWRDPRSSLAGARSSPGRSVPSLPKNPGSCSPLPCGSWKASRIPGAVSPLPPWPVATTTFI